MIPDKAVADYVISTLQSAAVATAGAAAAVVLGH